MASNQQISQLVLQVDASVAVAQRNLQQLARTVQDSSTTMNSSLATVETAHARLGVAFNNSRIAQSELTAAVTRSVDAYGAGASPVRILTTEMGRLAEMATFMGGNGGAMGKLAAFMSGPWGLAILVGVAVLAKLVSAHKDAGDSVGDLVDKMRKQAAQAQDSKQADIIWANSIDGLIDRNEKLIDTLQKRLKAEEDLDAQTLKQAQHDAATAQSDLATAKTRLANLQAQQAANDNANATGGAGMRAGSLAPVGQSNVLSAQIAQAQQDVATAQRAVEAARAAITQNVITVGEQEGKALVDLGSAADLWSKRYIAALHGIENANHGALADSTQTISSGFYALDKALKDAASAGLSGQFYKARTTAKDLGNELAAGKITAEQYADKMKALAAALEAAAAAAKDAKKGTGELGKQIGFADAESIAKSAGLTVTSGQRTDAQQAALYNDPRYNHPGNPVARPVSMGGVGSAHEGLNGKWALDIAFAPGLTADKLKKLYGDQGVSLSAVYKESGHFHIEGSTSQATAAQKAADRAAQKQQVDDDQFAKQSAQLDAETLAVRKQLVGGYDTQATYAEDELDTQKQASIEAIKKEVDGKQITVAQGKILTAKLEELDTAKKAVIEHQKYLDALEQAGRVADQAYGFQVDDLKFADDMATTQGEHRKVQLEILDIQYQQREADLERLKKTIESNADFATSVDLQNQARLVQGQIDRLPTQKAQDQSRVNLGTMDPLQAWAHQVPHDAAAITEALKSIEVQGLDGLTSAIDLTNLSWKNLGQSFEHVGLNMLNMLIQLGEKMLILNVLKSVMPSLFGGTGAGASGVGGFSNDALSFGGVSMRAAGGPVGAGQPYMVGDGGRPELFVPNTNGIIVPSVPRMNFSGANDNRPAPIVINQQFSPNFAGNAATYDDLQRMAVMTKSATIKALDERSRRRS